MSLLDEKVILEHWPLPGCIIDESGEIFAANKSFSDIFNEEITGQSITTLLGLKLKAILEGGKERPVKFTYNKNVYKILSKFLDEEKGLIVVFLKDVTALENLKVMYNDLKEAIVLVQTDNYEELLQGTSDENRGSLLSMVEKNIRGYFLRFGGAVTRIGGGKYIIFLGAKHLDTMAAEKYSLLDDVRSLETETEFPATLSIGIGASGKTLQETEDFAGSALELALGRGGDQAVVKKGSRIEYFGGKSMTVEKTNKGRSRVIGHALSGLINQSSKVFIMGHKNPDMDSFGASLGLFRMCDNSYNEAYIILDKYNETLKTMVEAAKETESYNFLTGKEALEIFDKKSLLILVDFHRTSLAEEPLLIKEATKIAIIDHHRRTEDVVLNPVLQYIEPYASSTSELVCEVLSYAGDKSIDKTEAEALLAGITMDTNRFSVKTGVRTFEACAWLRKQGADTTMVKRFFQTDMKSYKVRAKSILKAQIDKKGNAVTICDGEHHNAQVICAQIADELLSIKGIKAGYAAARDTEGYSVMSARSLGDVNVQVIMEKLRGGGHLTTAGCQSDESPEKLIHALKDILKEEE